jgi:RES domain-containing protein
MYAFRIAKAPHADLGGKGGLYASGRWHRRGMPIVYTAASRALAILETLAHMDTEDVPDDLLILTIDGFNEVAVERVEAGALPADWQAPLHPACMEIGHRWLTSGSSPVLSVPSVMVPEERNLLINPRHPDAGRLRIAEARPFAFDPRLLDPAYR